MREGLYLGAPPVNVRRAGARRFHFSLMRGAGSYSGAAGGFGQVPAIHQPLQRFRAPSTANRPDSIRLTELYAQQPGLFKQRLARMFHEPRARVTSGRLRDLVPQVTDDA